MKKLLAVILLSGFATTAYAACTTNSYVHNGKLVICTTCCYNGNCNTICN